MNAARASLTPIGLPETLGRYDVLGRLGAGGMAEVLLGRQEGAAGFERFVAIKRLLPHFAEDSELATMFVDEGRVLARIRHPNVVTVEDLVDDGDTVFLVMEHLVGESLSNFSLALRARALRLPPALAAYVVAEAAAGLHAAHELRDEAGRSLRLVHRDVSPQNLFVTEQGEVKVLDFGIARHDDRLGITRTGHAPGKLAYMSPEQLSARGVDRRTDVFALGVVLFELLTERRLFRRESDIATIRAVCTGPIPDPRDLADGVPGGVAEACLRALSRAPDARFATALQLREALLDACAATLGPGPELLLADLLRSVLGDQLDERVAWQREMRRRFASVLPPRSASAPCHSISGSSTFGALPYEPSFASAPDTDPNDHAANSFGPADSPQSSFIVPPPAPLPREAEVGTERDRSLVAATPRGARQSAWVWGVVALAAMVAFVGGLLWDPEPGPAARLPLLQEPREPILPALEGSAPVGAAPGVETTAVERNAAATDEVTLEIDTEPPGATVELDEVLLGTTPLTTVIPREDVERVLTFERDGYARDEHRIRPTTSHAIHRVLRRAPPRQRSAPPDRDLGDLEGPDTAGIAIDYP